MFAIARDMEMDTDMDQCCDGMRCCVILDASSGNRGLFQINALCLNGTDFIPLPRDGYNGNVHVHCFAWKSSN